MAKTDDEPLLRLANGLTVANVAEVMIRHQQAIDRGDLIFVDRVGWVPKQLLDGFRIEEHEVKN